LTVSPPGPLALAPGATLTLTATARAADGTELDRPIEWHSSDDGVATVSAGGQLLAASEGEARITARCGGVEAALVVSVSTALEPVDHVTIVEGGALTLEPGETTTLHVIAYAADGDVLSGRMVTWSSTVTEVATVGAANQGVGGGVRHRGGGGCVRRSDQRPGRELDARRLGGRARGAPARARRRSARVTRWTLPAGRVGADPGVAARAAAHLRDSPTAGGDSGGRAPPTTEPPTEVTAPTVILPAAAPAARDAGGRPRPGTDASRDPIESPMLTQAGYLLGTPAYMAAELHAGVDSGPVRDVYSFGVLAFELLIGRRPYARPALVCRLRRQPIGEALRLSELAPTLAPELARAPRATHHRRAQNAAPRRGVRRRETRSKRRAARAPAPLTSGSDS
jgi:hypothetical protein